MSAQHAPYLLTVKQFAAKHPAFTEGSLRWMIFQASGNGAGANGNYSGLQDAIVRIGRRVLINEPEFFSWVTSQGGAACN